MIRRNNWYFIASENYLYIAKQFDDNLISIPKNYSSKKLHFKDETAAGEYICSYPRKKKVKLTVYSYPSNFISIWYEKKQK